MNFFWLGLLKNTLYRKNSDFFQIEVNLVLPYCGSLSCGSPVLLHDAAQTLLVTRCVGVSHKSPTAATCLIAQLSSDTVYLEIDLSLIG